MENQNKYYELIKPVRILKKEGSGRKKELMILGIMILVICGVAVISNTEKLNILPQMEFGSSQINPTMFSLNNSLPIDPTLILNVPKSSTGILYG